MKNYVTRMLYVVSKHDCNTDDDLSLAVNGTIGLDDRSILSTKRK